MIRGITMFWARIDLGGRVLTGTIERERFHVHSGDMFEDAPRTGESVAL